MKLEYILGAVLLALVVFGGGWVLLKAPVEEAKVSGGTPYHEIVDPSGFVNTDGITIGELVGKKVILVDFLTYSCINCQRTFPYMNAWYEKYKDQGLEIIGIHTPEFAFEKVRSNVQKALDGFGIKYPIVLDNNYATWRAYENQYWPRKYIIDIHGNIVYDHIGEGAYEETEMKIQELLAERAQVLGEKVVSDGGLAASGIIEVAIESRSPETYFGSGRNEYFANGERGIAGKQTLVVPDSLVPNALYLGGSWDIQREYAETAGESARIVYRYSAGDVYLVAESDAPVEIEVFQDGKPVGVYAGEDVVDGVVVVEESRLYKMIQNETPGEHVLEFRVKGAGVRVFAFTFG